MQTGCGSGEGTYCFHECGGSEPMVSTEKKSLCYCPEYMLQCHWIQPLSWIWCFIRIICVDFTADNLIFRFAPPQYLSFKMTQKPDISLLCYPLKVRISSYFYLHILWFLFARAERHILAHNRKLHLCIKFCISTRQEKKTITPSKITFQLLNRCPQASSPYFTI